MLRRNLLLLLSLIAAPVMAQEASTTIDPGMTHDEVVQRLGKPLNERTSGTHTYMFYRNGCEKSCGMNDLVVLEDGKVVDAVFRNGVRSYSGTSSSPTAIHPSSNADRATSATSAASKVRKAKRGGIVIAQPASDDSSEAGKPAKATKPAKKAKTTKSATAVITGVQVAPAAQPAPSAAPATPAPTSPAPTSPVLGARINPADSVRALTPNRPTPIPGTKLNATDSARAEAIRRQQKADSTRKP